MATLDLEDFDIDSEYSDEFELEDVTESHNSSEDESREAVVAQLQKSLGKETSRPLSSQTNRSKLSDTTRTMQGKGVSPTQSGDFSRTVRTPMKLDTSHKSLGSTTSQGGTTKDSKKFNSSIDVRDACYSDWLSQKRSSISLDNRTKVMAQEKEEMKKKLKQVSIKLCCLYY